MWPCPLLLWLLLSLALHGQPGPQAPEDAGELHCGPQGLQFTVHPQGPGSGAPPALIAWGKAGACTHSPGSGSSARRSASCPPVLLSRPRSRSRAPGRRVAPWRTGPSGPAPLPSPADDHGLQHPLRNDSSCGTRVTAGPGSALVLEAAYGGCYVTEWVSRGPGGVPLSRPAPG